MDRSQASALADLQMHWDEAYVITLDGNIWCARYRTSAVELRAHTSSELRELIRSDYAYRQKADLLVAYDPDEDYEFGDGDAADDDEHEDEDEEVEVAGDGDGESAAGEDRQHRDDSSAGRRNIEVGDFATIHGEHMSL